MASRHVADLSVPKPMFFSTKDMCMRFLVKDAEVVIPQRLTEHMLKPEDLSLVQDDTG